jgi:hypothetical protein
MGAAMMTASILSTALACVRRGHAVLPLTFPVDIDRRLRCSCRRALDCTAPAKHPLGRLVPNGVLSASADEATVRKWFADEPLANLGVVTDRLIVIDADPRHGGDESLVELESEHAFPLTWRVHTGGGGEHVIFAAPSGVTVNCSNAQSNALLGPGLDVRARGGYIVAPPSRHISGRAYAWSVDHHPADVPLAEAPAWLVERLNGGGDNITSSSASEILRRDAAAWAAARAGTITEYRDMEVAKVAGKLLRAVSLDPAFVATLVQDWNACHCRPPLSEREVTAIFNRIARREIARLENSHAR